jgi:two-component system sensor histidine kinase AlgZ
VEWAVDGAPMDLLLPPLLLQPLVENAVYHGVQPLPEGGVVRIAAQVDTDGLVIRIENPRPAQITVRKGGHGMAQDNVRQRLHYAFGDHARLEVIERPGYYAAVLHLPLTSYESRP